MMKACIIGSEADRLGFGLAGVRVCRLEEVDEETLLIVSHDVDVKDTEAMVARLPCTEASHP
jgi:vacuolar-type H+-ATPase subunit F/Vma7